VFIDINRQNGTQSAANGIRMPLAAVHAVVRNGNYAVTMFFAISGFLITSITRRRWGSLGAIDARAFYVSRLARIIPCLVLLLAVVNGLAAAGVPIFTNHAPQGTLVSLRLVDLAAPQMAHSASKLTVLSSGHSSSTTMP
jgi:peptidoglycan/LPS O-acetylase OafA/YrhL